MPTLSYSEKDQIGLTSLLIRWNKEVSPGISLRGWRSRPSGKPLIHFIHGTGLCSLAYEPFLARLTNSFDLFLYDIQGHGDSDEVSQFSGWLKNAEETHQVWKAFRDEYGDVTSIGIGHSLGGVLTLLRSRKYKHDFSMIYLLDPYILSPNLILSARVERLLGYKRKLPLVELTRRRRNGWPDEHSAFDFFEKRGIFKTWNTCALKAYVKHGIKLECGIHKLKCSPKFEASIFESVPEKLWFSIRKIKTPTHILYGDQTYPFIRSNIVKARRQNKLITTEVINGSHFFVQEQPEKAAQRIEHLILNQASHIKLSPQGSLTN